jgi:tetratricopeptide (TPR) repeat protein
MSRTSPAGTLERSAEGAAETRTAVYADVPEPVRREAIRRLETRIETLRDSPWVDLWRAQRELFLLQERSALERLYRVVAREGDAASEVREAACHELANLYRRRGEHRRALAFYRRAREEGRSAASALVGQAETLEELGDGAAAEASYRQALDALRDEEAPIAVACGEGIARVLAGSGRTGEAAAVLAALHRRFPFRTELKRLHASLE